MLSPKSHDLLKRAMVMLQMVAPTSALVDTSFKDGLKIEINGNWRQQIQSSLTVTKRKTHDDSLKRFL